MRPPRRPDLLLATAFALGACLFPRVAAAADERVAAGGLVTLEGWKTDAQSEFPGRNGGDPASDGSLYAWMAANLGAGFNAFVQGFVAAGNGTVERTSGPELDQAYVRYTYADSTRLVVEAGKIMYPIGNFPRRYLPNVSPLISAPAGYGIDNPLGLRVSGWAGALDYTVAAVDLPWTYGADVPEPGSALRPALEIGVTPIIGLRFGVYGTRGPYLEDRSDIKQTVAGLDLQFSSGYFVLNGDFSRSRYELPDLGSLRGRSLWLEPVYAWSPRVFTALRIEQSDEPYIESSNGTWEAELPRLFDVEAGIGVRILPQMVVKLSYRIARWKVDDDLRADFPEGHALAAQVSYTFDVGAWFRRPN